MEKRVTINTLAKQLEVNPSTVSRAFDPDSNISDEVREKILKLAEKEGYRQNKAASRLTMKELKIGILINDTYPECFPEVTRGFKDAYERFYDYKISYEIIFFKNSDQNAENARKYFEHFDDCAGLIVSGLTTDEMAAELIRYSEKHKNIVAMQSEKNDLPYIFASTHDGESSAAMACEFLSIALGKDKNIVLFTGNHVLEVHSDTEKAFLKKAKEFGLNVCTIYDMNDNEELLAKQTEELFQKFTPDGIYISSGKSIPLCKYIKENGLSDKVTLVTSDTYPELNEYVKDGTVKATIYQNFYSLAYSAFATLIEKTVDKKETPQRLSPRPELVLRSNIHLYEQKGQ